MNTVIANLNDDFRRTGQGGRIVLTNGAMAHLKKVEKLMCAVAAVRSYSDFDTANDPFGEHDFGSFDVAGEKLFWKIDYYDQNMQHGSADPADPEVTTRVMTIMLASEY